MLRGGRLFLCVADSIVNAQPVKAEMSVASGRNLKQGADQLDVILVCRQAVGSTRAPNRRACRRWPVQLRSRLPAEIFGAATDISPLPAGPLTMESATQEKVCRLGA